MNTTQISQRPTHRVASILAVIALALGLSACGKTEDPTVGQRLDSAVEKTEQAATDTRNQAESAMQSAENKIEQGANTAKAAMDDAAITAQVSASLAKDPDLSALAINVDTKDGVVTLTGPAKSQQASDRATQLAKGIDGVKRVENKLEIRP